MSDLRVGSPFDVTAERMGQWRRRNNAFPRALSIEAKLQRMLESRVGARQSSQPATLATHLEQREARGELREEAVLTYRSDLRDPHTWEVEMRARISKLTRSISPDRG